MRTVILSLLVISACGNNADDDDPSADASSGADAPGADAGVPRAPDLGESCPMGCNLTLCVDPASSDCSTAICVWDGRRGFDSYCSQPCPDGLCPDGWSCLESDDGEGRFCFADEAVCGDGVLQRGEACDAGAGNGTPESGCAADCSGTLQGGTLEYSWDGNAIAVDGTSADGGFSGEVGHPFVELGFYVPEELAVNIRIEADDLVEPFPRVVDGRVDFTFYFETWCFTGQTIRVDSWDGRRLQGAIDGTVSYSRCCSFCVDPDVTSHEVAQSGFDVNF